MPVSLFPFVSVYIAPSRNACFFFLEVLAQIFESLFVKGAIRERKYQVERRTNARSLRFKRRSNNKQNLERKYYRLASLSSRARKLPLNHTQEG